MKRKGNSALFFSNLFQQYCQRGGAPVEALQRSIEYQATESAMFTEDQGLCMDCGKDTQKSGEYFHLKDPLWRRINPLVIGMMCLDCVEDRLGRHLCRSDFSAAAIHARGAQQCPALAGRLARKETDRLVSQRPPRRRRKKVQSRMGRISRALLAYRGKNGRVSTAALRRFLKEHTSD